MKTTTAVAATLAVIMSMTASADPTRDGESIVEGTLDKGDCELVLEKNIENAGLSKELKEDYYRQKNGGFELLRAKVGYYSSGDCVIHWFRTVRQNKAQEYLQDEFPGKENWDELGWGTQESNATVHKHLKDVLQDEPLDIILEPVLENTDNVEVRMTTMFAGHDTRKETSYIVTKYHSKDF